MGRRMCAQPDADRVSVRGGTAVLSVAKVRTDAACPDGFWHNGMIGTKEATPGFVAKHGIFAARIKFQSAQGMHGAFWLQGPPGTGAEIDVAEFFGDGRDDSGLSSYVHHTAKSGTLSSSGGVRDLSTVLGTRSPAAGWHIYSLEWSDKGYVTRLDGRTLLRTSQPYVSTAEQGMILSLLTSDYELPRLEDPSSVMRLTGSGPATVT